MVAQIPLWELSGVVSPRMFLVREPVFPLLWNAIQSQPIAEWILSANLCSKLINESEHCDLLWGSEPSFHCDSSLPPCLHWPWLNPLSCQIPSYQGIIVIWSLGLDNGVKCANNGLVCKEGRTLWKLGNYHADCSSQAVTELPLCMSKSSKTVCPFPL